MLTKITRTIFLFNIDIICVYAIILATVLLYIVPSSTILLTALAHMLLLIGIYMLNKLSDSQEDTHNKSAIIQTKKPLILLTIFAFCSAITLYLMELSGLSLLLSLSMCVLGILYSYPKNLRFKNILFLKNITDAYCWYISVVTLYFISSNNSHLLYFLIYCIPLFIFAFIFNVLLDMPDIYGDRIAKVYTLPNYYGIDRTKYILVSIVLVFLLVNHTTGNLILMTLLLTSIVWTQKNTTKNTIRIIMFCIASISFFVNYFLL